MNSNPGSVPGLSLSIGSLLLTARWSLQRVVQHSSKLDSTTTTWRGLLAILLLRLADRCIRLAAHLIFQLHLGYYESLVVSGNPGEAAGGGAPVIRFTSRADSTPLR